MSVAKKFPMLHETTDFDSIIGRGVFDIRDVCERFDALKFDGLEDEEQWREDNPDEGEELIEEFRDIENFLSEVRGYGGDHQYDGEWYPLIFIHENSFAEYARDLADDLYGAEMRDSSWPFNCIDWEQAAEELKGDYSPVDIDSFGKTHGSFYYR